CGALVGWLGKTKASEGHHLACREAALAGRALRKPSCPAGTLAFIELRRGPAGQVRGAAAGREEPRQELEQRGFARAVLAHEHHTSPGLDRQLGALDALAEGHSGQAGEWRHSGCSSTRRASASATARRFSSRSGPMLRMPGLTRTPVRACRTAER